MYTKERWQGGYKKVVQDQSALENQHVMSEKQVKTVKDLGTGAGFYSPGTTGTNLSNNGI